jgi:hypothetical protein
MLSMYSSVMLLLFFRRTCCSVLLFDTENGVARDYFDCIYQTNTSDYVEQFVKYCIRPENRTDLNRTVNTTGGCLNGGILYDSQTMKQRKINSSDVLMWSSTVELADRYAAYLAGRSGYVISKVRAY